MMSKKSPQLEFRRKTMWQRMSGNARKAVYYAQTEAQKYRRGEVSSEHLFLGVIADGTFAAAQVLAIHGIDLETVKAAVEKRLPTGTVSDWSDMTLTPAGKKVIDVAYSEALSLGNTHVGTEHLLLGVVAGTDGIAAQALLACDVTLESTREMVRVYQGPARPEPFPAPKPKFAQLMDRLTKGASSLLGARGGKRNP